MAIQVSCINGMGAITEASPGVFTTTGMDDSDHMHIANDFIARAGVRDLLTDYIVAQRGAGANMSVDVSVGTAYVLCASWSANVNNATRYWRLINDDTINAVITANASGNPRIDAVCLKVDTGASPDGSASNVASIEVTAGVPAATPSAPATPSNQLLLAYVAVANGAVSIVTANITDKRVSSQLDIGDGFNHSMTRQAIMNGNFDIWQRGTTVTGLATGGFIADRWKWSFAVDGGTDPTLVQSRQALTAGDIPNSFYHYRIAPNGAGSGYGVNSYHMLSQAIEFGTRFLCGANKKITVTFYARASVASKRLGLYISQGYGTGGAPTATEIINGTNWTLTSSWVKYSWTFSTNTLVGKTFGTANDDSLNICFVPQWSTTLMAPRVGATTAETFGGNGTIDIAQVQVNAGDTSLLFEPMNYQTEMALCHRFFWSWYSTDDAYTILGQGIEIDATHAFGWCPFPVVMRADPAATFSAGADFAVSEVGSDVACSTIADNRTTRYGLKVYVTVAAGLTANRPCFIVSNNKTTASVFYSAEL